MTEIVLDRCLRLIETRWRGVHGWFGDAERRTLCELLDAWPDATGERACRKWVWESSDAKSLDIASLARIHADMVRPSNGAALDRSDPRWTRGERRRACFVEGWLDGWRQLHPGQDPTPDQAAAGMRWLRGQLTAEGIGAPDPFADDEEPVAAGGGR